MHVLLKPALEHGCVSLLVHSGGPRAAASLGGKVLLEFVVSLLLRGRASALPDTVRLLLLPRIDAHGGILGALHKGVDAVGPLAELTFRARLKVNSGRSKSLLVNCEALSDKRRGRLIGGANEGARSEARDNGRGEDEKEGDETHLIREKSCGGTWRGEK